MKPAEEFQLVADGVYFWQNYEPAVKCDLSSAAVKSGAGLVLIDPIPLAPGALEELAAVAAPALIVLTNGNHARAAADYRERFSIPIAAHPEAATELGIGIDLPAAAGATLPGGCTVIDLPGACAGEIALLFENGVLCMGDALINLDPRGFSILPEKYCTDADALRVALRKLLRFEWQLMTFAHGLPLAVQARSRLESLLA